MTKPTPEEITDRVLKRLAFWAVIVLLFVIAIVMMISAAKIYTSTH